MAMETPLVSSPPLPMASSSGLSSRSRSSSKLVDDVTSLTSYNPFSEEDENDQSSYTIVSSLFSKMRNTLVGPLSSAVAAAASTNASGSNNSISAVQLQQEASPEQRRPPNTAMQTQNQNASNGAGPSRTSADRPTLSVVPSNPAPPLVSLTPVVSEAPTFNFEVDRTPNSAIPPYGSPGLESHDGPLYGTAIPGFPIQDDARSIRTMSAKRSASVSKVMRRIRGEGLSRDYWMDDENCKECYDCKSVFSAWRRKHHCRICGQIFCARCASNIIKGSRFGHEGMLRVCNLCLEKLAEVDEEDDDERKSTVSSVTSRFPNHHHDALSFRFPHHPQSPFAASHIFGRTDEPFNLFSIAETRGSMDRSDDSGLSSRSMTPDHLRSCEETRDRARKSTAPFRRTLVDEDRDGIDLPHGTAPNGTNGTANGNANGDVPPTPGTNTPIEFPSGPPNSGPDGTSSVQFPVSISTSVGPGGMYALESPSSYYNGQSLGPRSRFNSYADGEAAAPFIRSRVQSGRVPESGSFGMGVGMGMGIGEPGWRTRRESTAYAQELNQLSMFHLRIMLRQMLTTEQIPNLREWEETLLKLALRIARELTFTGNPHRQGTDMDVRRYVKIKKIPGGAPRDSEYVDGAVITKNSAHKQMSRAQRNPRVMLVTFPLEFHRVEGQYMHFGQIVRQEKEYLGNLASRIAALRPHVLLVEKSVSRLALDELAKHKITVARSVRPSAIQFVARMTQGDVFSSIDKLALEPRLGHCARFRIQTFDHPLIPGRRKTYMRFEGCSHDMGCTIMLRGGDLDVLRRVKKVTRFLTFIVRNLKLETHLWKDLVITLPSLSREAIPPGCIRTTAYVPKPSIIPARRTISASPSDIIQMTASSGSSDEDDRNSDEESLPNEEAEQQQLSKRIQQSLEPYLKTFISVSATLRFPPPYPIRRMKELDDELLQAKQAWEDEIILREERAHFGAGVGGRSLGHAQEDTITPTTFQDELRSQIEALPDPEMDGTPKAATETDRSGSEASSSYFDHRTETTTSNSSLVSTPWALASPVSDTPSVEEAPVQLKTTADIAKESRLSYVKCQHEEARRIWEWYLRKNRDDFVVEKYQCISLWEYTLPIEEYGLHRACFPPRFVYVKFYGENDCTLGQFIEKSVMDTLVQFLDPKATCSGKGCIQPLARHCKVYVHNEARLLIAVEQWDGQIKGRMNYSPSPDLITTWSVCRVCGSATPFIPVSEEMQRYSFAKFLELHFYPADVKLVQGAGCEHNIYRDHIRYFAIKGMTVRFQADPVVLHEVVYPPTRIRVRPETLLEIRNSDYERLLHRNIMWYTALVDDLKLINIDAATGDEETDAKLTADINVLIARAEHEKNEVTRLINKIYKESSPVDTLALNQVRAFRQDKIVEWQQDFDRLPKPRAAHGMDRASRRASAFGTVRAMWPRRYEMTTAMDQHAPSSSVSEAEEVPAVIRKDTDVSVSSASEPEESEAGDKKEKSPTSRSETEVSVTDQPASTTTEPAAPGSDPESDSTIGAGPSESASPEAHRMPSSQDEPTSRDRSVAHPPVSRLPRRAAQHPTVAELVRKYQEYIPPQGVQELAKTAFPPTYAISESEQETTSQARPRPMTRSRIRHHIPIRRPSLSDFEGSYAANIAPRYLTHSRRPGGPGRIPAPVTSSFESGAPSRRVSPDKRPSFFRSATESSFKNGRTSPPGNRPVSVMFAPCHANKAKPTRSSSFKDKAPSRPTSTVVTKSGFRRTPAGPGNKVSNITRHFERMNKENERATRRYAVIRGKRARPVASARAKVEVLESVQDVIGDETDASDSSSEADDEGDDEDENVKTAKKVDQKTGPGLQLPSVIAEVEPEVSCAPTSIEASDQVQPSKDTGTAGSPSSVPPPRPVMASSSPPSPILPPMPMGSHLPPVHPFTELETAPTGTERHSILRALSTLWPQQFPQPRPRMELEVDDPMADPEHIFRESSMVVRTDEPTSIIALALNSPQYRDMLAKSRAEKRQIREPKVADGSGEAFMPDDMSIADSTSTWGVVNVEFAEGANPTEEMRVPSSKLPWQISFESSGLTITCTVLYPEQFDALRRTYDCEKSMIESLARCIKWNASGGKSGSAFLKTQDDRFIAKELSRAELQTMETFGPAYFDYMSSAVQANRPTLLAKVFGCYKITFKKTKDTPTNRSRYTQMNLLVMENLFYDRRFSKIYDLKGSTRNRHVQSTGRENEVLLDENLVETAHLTPFYLREHSKRILRGSLYNDSKFLADINVMDYSLVVGVDSANNELVVGIVDYIRTYTWDKKLESWVKDLGGAGKGEPTIITPKQYRQRFLSAMERYFPLVPDRWMKQRDTPEEEGNSLLELWPDW